jgi:hypothetical protein
VAHLASRFYGAGLTANKKLMVICPSSFAKSIVIKLPNEGLVALGGELRVQACREAVFKAQKERSTIV